MIKTRESEGHVQSVIPLQVRPTHRIMGSIIGSAIGKQAGTVMYGFNSMDYDLGGDKLRLIANHHKPHVQILLLTSDPEKIKKLPGKRPVSLVANTIAQVNRYLLRATHYVLPRTPAQEAKFRLAQNCIDQLTLLLETERQLVATDWSGHERIRRHVIHILETCRDENCLLANDALVSEGELGNILYEARQAAQYFEYNRYYQVSRFDQLDFTEVNSANYNLIWDSELHIGYDEKLIDDTIRAICEMYHLEQADDLKNIPANRFKRVEVFFRKLWAGGKDWIEYLKLPKKPTHKQTIERRNDMSIITIKPYYYLEGPSQGNHSSLQELVNRIIKRENKEIVALSIHEGEKKLNASPNNTWCHIADLQLLLIRQNNQLLRIRYSNHKGIYKLLPHGQDLYTLTQLSKRHLYFFERFGLRIKAFFSHIPVFLGYFSTSLSQFIKHDILDEFVKHIHRNHELAPIEIELPKPKINPSFLRNLQEILQGKQLMGNGQSLHEFIHTQLENHRYMIAREEHPISPITYNNPFHRTFNILRHFSAFFIDNSEKNPLIGSLAIAAYLYGAGAIIAPQLLTGILSKLHLHGLIKGIEPTQALGRWMSNGTMSEALSAAVTYWQGIIVGGELDQFFIKAIDVLHEDPAEVAIIISLAIGLGYSLCEVMPSLAEEMGRFPYINYAALGAKSGAAIYDTVMYPGEDWLLGTIKWFLRGGVIIAQLFIAPFIESYHYGFYNGLLSGFKKSAILLVKTLKEIIAASTDLILLFLTVPFLEVSAMLLHVPFRGISSLFSKTLGALSSAKYLGQFLIELAKDLSQWDFFINYHFSPLYGVNGLTGQYSSNKAFNFIINSGLILFTPVWQILKNIVLLPALDISSFIIRLNLTVFSNLTSTIAFLSGKLLLAISPIWDNTVGKLCHFSAQNMTVLTNWVDNFSGQFRQIILSQIQVCRRAIFHWAFAEKDNQEHRINNNCSYFLDKPIRLEHLPTPSSHFLMQALFDEINEGKPNFSQNPHYEPLFCSQYLGNNLSDSSLPDVKPGQPSFKG